MVSFVKVEGSCILETVYCVMVKRMDSGVQQNWSIKSFQKTTLGFVDPLYCIFVFPFH